MKRGWLGLLLLVSTAYAEPTVLRIATAAPDGTAWAREMKGFDRDLQAATGGAVRIKWYFGGIAGDEMTALDRVRRGQLEGLAAGIVCQRVIPSLRVTRISGLFQTRGEASYVVSRLHETLEAEAQSNGFTLLSIGHFGTDVEMTRTPVHSMAELRKQKLWIWDLDEVLKMHLPAMGLQVVPLPLDKAGEALAGNHLDGVHALASAALAFQWSTQVKYFSNLRGSFLSGCVVIANRAFDKLPIEQQRALRDAGARFRVRFEDLGQQQDDTLLKVFQKQGVTPVEVSSSFRAEFLEAARAARERLGDRLVPRALLAKAQELLADYRAEHRAPER